MVLVDEARRRAGFADGRVRDLVAVLWWVWIVGLVECGLFCIQGEGDDGDAKGSVSIEQHKMILCGKSLCVGSARD